MSLITATTAIQPGQKRHWGNLCPSGQALSIAESAKLHQGVTVVITKTAQEAAHLCRAIEFFLVNTSVPTLLFPDWEILAYDIFSPHQDIISGRLQILASLPKTQQAVLVVALPTLLHQLPPIGYVASRTFDYRVGESLNRTILNEQLGHAGYQRVETVYEHGEYAFRGSIIDIYPMGEKNPFRIDLLDDEIESLRIFDADTQRTLQTVEQLQLLPAREFPLDKEGINCFLNNWHDHFDGDPNQCQLYLDVKEGIAPQGIEYYLKLFFDQTATLFDYLPDTTRIFTQSGLEEASKTFWQEVNHRFEEYGIDKQRPLLKPKHVFVAIEALFSQLKKQPLTILGEQPVKLSGSTENLSICQLTDISVNAKLNNPLEKLQAFMESLDANSRLLFCAESAGRREILLELLGDAGIKPDEFDCWEDFLGSKQKLGITTYPIDQGFYHKDKSFCLITEGELFGQQVLQQRRRSVISDSPNQVFKNLAELKEGAPVVHLEHGVGRYEGLITLPVDGAVQEFLSLLYAQGSRLYVPVSSLHLISRFSGGDETTAPLHQLGSDKWDKAKQKAQKQVRDTAAELLDIYSRRASKQGFACTDNNEDYLKFCSEFAFEETPDQLSAIEAVRRDMLASQPMDRLVCGDVGFGKTEVAMRASFMAVTSGKQVVILVPTTLLAHQHLENFRDRFSNWPVHIEELSRFRSTKQQQQILADMTSGKIDILISTHKLLHASVDFSHLGLMIIDEEHRFGVRQKEQIKALRSSVDMLTMTATPIPRTLNMSMHSIRDLSIIASPPARRLAVKTFICKEESRATREAILREVLRGGQVYYLHNDIKTIQQTAEKLSELVPEARIDVAHGQMRERQLEQIMSDFYRQRFNVLVCTTIIETGIDIPSANTILIERADKFGLAQLHQLRGRVGRSHHQAYAYLLTPTEKKLTSEATKRLQAIAAADHLGSGFTLATNDLEIRGAGELLGENQSGHIQTIGFTLYLEMLDQAVTAMQNGDDPKNSAFDKGIEVNLHLSALIPEDYIADTNTRLTLYKRLSNCVDKQQLHDLQVEMIDRFGLLPESLKTLIKVTELRQIGEKLGLTKIEAGPKGGRLEFSDNTIVTPITIIQMIQNDPATFRLQNNNQLNFSAVMESAETRFSNVYAILDLLLKSTELKSTVLTGDNQGDNSNVQRNM